MIKFNGIEVAFTRFPNGETKMDETSIVVQAGVNKVVEFKYQDDSDLIKLMFLKEYLDNKKVDISELVIYYMPYSRMDRTEDDSPFTLKYISKFINSMNFNKITVIEPHSDVTMALLDNAEAVSFILSSLPNVIKEIGFDVNNDYIVFPDTTSNKRYSLVDIPNQLTGIKHRDFETGRIKSLELSGQVYNKGFKALMVDDLCSYGGTFLLTAEKLRDLGATEIYLLVGHCENSIFKGDIFKTDLINKVFTTDTILTVNSNEDRIKIYEIERFLNERKN